MCEFSLSLSLSLFGPYCEADLICTRILTHNWLYMKALSEVTLILLAIEALYFLAFSLLLLYLALVYEFMYVSMYVCMCFASKASSGMEAMEAVPFFYLLIY